MTKSRIFVVEDDGVIILELFDRLAALGYDPCGKTSTAEDAVMLAEGLAPDLVLMDIRLQGAMDGIDAARLIRARFDIPVVFLTAYADDETLRRAQKTEPFGYVIKPFQERELRTAIEMALYKHRMERRLRERERWLATTLGSIGDAVVATDEEGYVLFLNGVAAAMLGCKPAAPLGQPVADVVRLASTVTSLAVPCPALEVLAGGGQMSLADHVLLSAGEDRRYIDGSVAPIVDARGRIRGVVLAFRDVTSLRRQQEEHERLQARLFHAERAEALSALAGEVIGDLNDLLTVVVGSAALIQEEAAALPGGAALRARAERAEAAGWQAAALARHALDAGEVQLPQLQVVDLNVLVAGLAGTLADLAAPEQSTPEETKDSGYGSGPGSDHELALDLAPEGCPVEVDPAQMEQAILNLAGHVCEALPPGGRLVLSTARLCLAEEQGAPPGTFVRLALSGGSPEHLPPVGPSMPAPALAWTEPEHLELAIAHTTVVHHDGWIAAHGEPGQDYALAVYLPAAGQEAAPRPAVGRILLVDGNELVRDSTAEMLVTLGYAVVAVPGAVAALEALEADGAAFDLLLADVVLPDRDGLWLAHSSLDLRPGLPIVLCSSHTDSRSRWIEVAERGFGFLRKPYGPAQLRRALDAALALQRRPDGLPNVAS